MTVFTDTNSLVSFNKGIDNLFHKNRNLLVLNYSSVPIYIQLNKKDDEKKNMKTDRNDGIEHDTIFT